jgi:uncharacterized membrane protein
MEKNETKNKRETAGREMKPPRSYAGEFPASDSKRPFSDTVNKAPGEVMTLLKNAGNLPQFLEGLEKVDPGSAGIESWHFKPRHGAERAKPVPFKTKLEGNSFTFSSEDKLGFDYNLAVTLTSAPGERGTIVRMIATYKTGTGSALSMVESLFGGDADLHTKKTLQRFKALCETGHVPTIDGQSSGREE